MKKHRASMNTSKQLAPYEVILRALQEQQGSLPVPLATAVVSIVKETSLKNSYTIQFNNVLFITHINDAGNTAVFRALNADTPQNYIRASIKYMLQLQKNGITRAVCDFNDPRIYAMVRALGKRHELKGFGMQIFKLPSGTYRACIDIPKRG